MRFGFDFPGFGHHLTPVPQTDDPTAYGHYIEIGHVEGGTPHVRAYLYSPTPTSSGNHRDPKILWREFSEQGRPLRRNYDHKDLKTLNRAPPFVHLRGHRKIAAAVKYYFLLAHEKNIVPDPRISSTIKHDLRGACIDIEREAKKMNPDRQDLSSLRRLLDKFGKDKLNELMDEQRASTT
ncbi:hypothetical protein BDV96DRAFT_655408 [Lophiotrema nucula]|uniref:Uncharacterized protein n=1 Tax=Lophiotrema nucula TaxID=690887 RepID=A0A6A5YET7_9PLEO|nr:hypothetical protein BDV96DRAFT_655408 [Lophiotrema nucula]